MRPTYARLTQYLQSEAGAVHEVLLSYGRIEELVGAPLPQRAKVDPSWWTGQAEGSIGLLVDKAGWHVEGVNRALNSVRFTRAPTAH